MSKFENSNNAIKVFGKLLPKEIDIITNDYDCELIHLAKQIECNYLSKLGGRKCSRVV